MTQQKDTKDMNTILDLLLKHEHYPASLAQQKDKKDTNTILHLLLKHEHYPAQHATERH